MSIKIPNIDTLSCLIDRLIIENHKIAFLENKKWDEQNTKNPDSKKITTWDKAMRIASESRSAIKNKIDELFKECIEQGKYEYIKETRTFEC